jgi:hypothetical protein
MDGSPPDPELAVVLSCYDRTEFVLEAARSALTCTPPGRRIELVAVKPFPHAQIDKELSELGWRVVITGVTPWAENIATGLGSTRATIVTFLDDDDLYLPGRLETVLEAFRSSPGLCFFRNGHVFIDRAGKKIEPPRTLALRARALERLGPISTDAQELSGNLSEVVRVAPDFNLSAMAVRRSLLMERLDELRKLSTALDSGLFFAALRSGGEIRIDPRKLTAYRVHGENVSLDPTANQPRFLAWRREYLATMGSIFAACCRDSPEPVRRLAAQMYLATRLAADRDLVPASRCDILSDLASFVRVTTLGSLMAYWDILAYSLLAVLSRPLATRSYQLARGMS